MTASSVSVRVAQSVPVEFRNLLAFFVAFLAAIAFGQWFGKIPAISITFWPPNGIYVAALLLADWRRWYVWIAAAACAELTGNLIWFHNSIPSATAYILINACEATFCAAVLKSFFPSPATLRTLEQALALTVTVLVAAAVGGTIAGALDWYIGKRPFGVTFEHWWVGDGAGMLLALPLALAAAEQWDGRPRLSLAEAGEALAIALTLSALCYFALAQSWAVLFVLMPPLLWAALRFEFVGGLLAVLLLAVQIGLMTLHQVGSIGLGLSERQTHVVMQFFLATASVKVIIVAAIARQRRETMAALKSLNEQLEARVAERTSQVQLLMREVNHRSKNLLMLVQALARQTAASGAADFQKRFESRLHSLAASQDLLVKSEWTSVPVEELVRSQLAHLGRDVETRFKISGPPIHLTAASAQTIGMALHELSTNAIKYGALSNSTGRIDLTWGTGQRDDGTPTFHMAWREHGGPASTPPERRGFGTVVIGDMVRLGLGGIVTKEFRAEGLVWTVEAPQETVLRPDGEPRTAGRGASPPAAN